jgi:hypothetical protein
LVTSSSYFEQPANANAATTKRMNSGKERSTDEALAIMAGTVRRMRRERKAANAGECSGNRGGAR